MSKIINPEPKAGSAIDPITAQVIWGALENVAIEMGHKLTRMSYSSIIRESEDFGAALLDPDCHQLCESVFSTPLQLARFQVTYAASSACSQNGVRNSMPAT